MNRAFRILGSAPAAIETHAVLLSASGHRRRSTSAGRLSAISLSRYSAAVCQGQLMAASVSTRRRQEADFRRHGPAGQSQLAAPPGKPVPAKNRRSSPAAHRQSKIIAAMLEQPVVEPDPHAPGFSGLRTAAGASPCASAATGLTMPTDQCASGAAPSAAEIGCARASQG